MRSQYPADSPTGDVAGAEEDWQRETPTANHRCLDSALQTRTENTALFTLCITYSYIMGHTYILAGKLEVQDRCFHFRRALTLHCSS